MRIQHPCRWACLIGIPLALSACATPQQSNALLFGGATLTLGHSPTTNIGQTYYLGVFDPREQLPPTIYRIRVQGQASALSTTAFASGWVRADLVDSLSGRVALDKDKVDLTPPDKNGKARPDDDKSALNRRLVMFGPEGFREAPKDHRLVIAMGSNPDVFFSAVDRALGVVAGVTQANNAGPDVASSIWSEMSRIRQERRAVQTLIDLASQD